MTILWVACGNHKPLQTHLWPMLVYMCLWSIQAHSCLALVVAERQSKAWKTVSTSEWPRTSCSCSLTLWSIQVWTRWRQNSMMDFSITPMEYCSVSTVCRTGLILAVAMSQICSVMKCEFSYLLYCTTSQYILHIFHLNKSLYCQGLWLKNLKIGCAFIYKYGTHNAVFSQMAKVTVTRSCETQKQNVPQLVKISGPLS